MCESLAAATCDVYSTVCAELRPSPSKPHLAFSPTLIWHWLSAMLATPPATLSDVDRLVLLWAHEGDRRVVARR